MKRNVDYEWFNEMTLRLYGSQRKLAAKMVNTEGAPLEATAVHKLFRGKQAMGASYRRQLATLLGVTEAEILRRAGFLDSVDAGPVQSSFVMVDVIGVLNKNLEVETFDTRSKREPDRVLAPSDMRPRSIAIRCQTARSVNDVIDGWVLLAEERVVPDSTSYGRLCFYWPQKGAPGLAIVDRGYRAGTVNLTAVPLFSSFEGTLENIRVDSVAPVLWTMHRR